MKDGQLLKRGSGREVRLESQGGEPIVVKRFEHGPAWRLGRGGRRARREFAALGRAYSAGLTVPEPLSLERAADAWEVRMRWVRDARPLSHLLSRDQTPIGGWEPFLGQLAVLLAGLVRAGIEHPDLHTGNVLVDEMGRPWLIDFHQARSKRTPSADWLVGEVVRWGALTREHLSIRARRTFLNAACSALPETQQAIVMGTTGDLADLEARSRAKRRALVLTGLGRWLRPSGKVLLEDATLVRKEANEALVRCPLTLAGEPEQLWRTAARLEEHHIRAPRPERFDRSSQRVAFRSPAVLERVAQAELPRRLGATLGLLHHRGLHVRALDESVIRVDAEGLTWLLPSIELEERRANRETGWPVNQRLRAHPQFRRAYRKAALRGRDD